MPKMLLSRRGHNTCTILSRRATSTSEKKMLLELNVWLASVDTHPDIISVIISGLSSWLTATPIPELDTAVETTLLHAMMKHMLLGWGSSYLFFTKSLIEYQQ